MRAILTVRSHETRVRADELLRSSLGLWLVRMDAKQDGAANASDQFLLARFISHRGLTATRVGRGRYLCSHLVLFVADRRMASAPPSLDGEGIL